MINIEDASYWDGLNTEGEKGIVIVDLRKVNNKSEAVLAMAEKLSGKDSPKLQRGKFDALNDVMSDWFIENWGKEKNIYILGGKRLLEIDAELAFQLCTIISSAFLGAIYTHSQSADQFAESLPTHKEINNTRVVWVLN